MTGYWYIDITSKKITTDYPLTLVVINDEDTELLPNHYVDIQGNLYYKNELILISPLLTKQLITGLTRQQYELFKTIIINKINNKENNTETTEE